MNAFGWLVRREYWEHRGGFLWAPVGISATLLALTFAGLIVLAFQLPVHGEVNWHDMAAEASHHGSGMTEMGQVLDGAYVAIAAILFITLACVQFFYFLGSLYDERRDRSVLFWKSLPVSDASTVGSKVVAGLLLAPIITLVVASVAYLVFIILVFGAANLAGLQAGMIISAAHPLETFGRLAVLIPLNAFIALPTVGWLMICSSYARSKPFLWAVLIPIVVVIADGWIGLMGLPHLGRTILFDKGLVHALFGLLPGGWLAAEHGLHDPDAPQQIMTLLDTGRAYHALVSPEIWLFAGIGVLLIALAGRRRRWGAEG